MNQKKEALAAAPPLTLATASSHPKPSRFVRALKRKAGQLSQASRLAEAQAQAQAQAEGEADPKRRKLLPSAVSGSESKSESESKTQTQTQSETKSNAHLIPGTGGVSSDAALGLRALPPTFPSASAPATSASASASASAFSSVPLLPYRVLTAAEESRFWSAASASAPSASASASASDSSTHALSAYLSAEWSCVLVSVSVEMAKKGTPNPCALVCRPEPSDYQMWLDAGERWLGFDDTSPALPGADPPSVPPRSERASLIALRKRSAATPAFQSSSGNVRFTAATTAPTAPAASSASATTTATTTPSTPASSVASASAAASAPVHTRTAVGYALEGMYSFAKGQGAALALVSLQALVRALQAAERCGVTGADRFLVLVRNTSSRAYKPAFLRQPRTSQP
jgi:hypothetical protein